MEMKSPFDEGSRKNLARAVTRPARSVGKSRIICALSFYLQALDTIIPVRFVHLII
jgi:hypothetical protein